MKNTNRFILLLLIALAALALTGCDVLTGATAAPTQTSEMPLVQEEVGVVVEGAIAPRDSARIYTRAGGTVAEVLVKKGDVVEKDAVLVRFGDRESLDAARTAAILEQRAAQQAWDDLNNTAGIGTAEAERTLIAARTALMDAQDQLDEVDTDAYQTDLDNAKTDIENARDEVEDAEEEWDRWKDHDEDNSSRKNAETRLEDAQKKLDDANREHDRLVDRLEDAQAAVDSAQAALDDAQREFDARKDGPDPDDLALAQARVDNAAAQLAAAEAALADLEIRAPFAGTVMELEVGPDEILLPNQQVALVADLSAWYVETTDLTEMDVVLIREGSPAEVHPDALEDLQFRATVEEIAWTAGKKGGDVTYTARLKLEETDPRLRWGMTVEVRFPEE